MPKNKKTKTAQPEGTAVISWTAPEYFQHPKSKRWYIIAGIVVVLAVAYAAYTGNWSMAAAMVVFAGVYQYLHKYQPPRDIQIAITDLGMKVGHMFFPYSHIQAFWLIYKHDLKTLNLRVAGNYWADIVIYLNDQDPVEIRSFLVGQIPEWEGKDERLGDLLLRKLKL